MASWRFNGADPAPLVAINVQTTESFSAWALEMTGKEARLLALPEISATGKICLNRPAGTLRFWHAPAYSSVARMGLGPGEEVVLLEVGAWSSQGAESWYSLVVDPDGNTIRFLAQSQERAQELLRAPIAWLAGEWHQVALVWSANETLLFLDGQRATAGPGVALTFPSSFQGAAGFCLGSDVHGGRLAQGQFEELYSFGRPCSEEDLAADFARHAPLAALGPVSAAEAKSLELAIAETALLRELGLLDEPPPGPDYGCALWLEIKPESCDTVRLILHNSEPGKTYQLWSSADVSDPGNWVPEQPPMVGQAGQNFTERIVTTEGRPPILSFQVTGLLELTVESSFGGMRNNEPSHPILGFPISEWAIDPPDTMAAVGLDYIVEIVNAVVVLFEKSTGAPIEAVFATDFFDAQSGHNVFDPQIIYDVNCQRWVACMADQELGGHVLLAVSGPTDPRGLLTTWTTYTIPVGEGGFETHTPSLGADQNGVYITVHLVSGSESKLKITAISKLATDCLTDIPPTQIRMLETLVNPYAGAVLCPAVSFDSVPLDGVAWFLSKGAAHTAPPYQPGPIQYCRLKWENGAPRLLDTDVVSWPTIPPPHPYFDLDSTNPAACENPNVLCAKSRDGAPIWFRTGSRFENPVVRNGYLWTCQQVGLNAEGGYGGEPVGTLRSGCQWYKFRINGDDSLTLADYGRVYDGSQDNFYYYFVPSIAVNSVGDMVMGFSGSGESSYVSAYYIGRLVNGPMPCTPARLKAGEDAREDPSWGDYSATVVDPDGLTFWTVQEYAESPVPPPYERDTWGTWIAKIRR